MKAVCVALLVDNFNEVSFILVDPLPESAFKSQGAAVLSYSTSEQIK